MWAVKALRATTKLVWGCQQAVCPVRTWSQGDSWAVRMQMPWLARDQTAHSLVSTCVGRVKVKE